MSDSDIESLNPIYSPEVVNDLIQNGLNIAADTNSARCVACAIDQRLIGL
jgi:hypothetical protein